MEGIDHALTCDASERPGEDDDLELVIAERQRLRRRDDEPHPRTGTPRVPPRVADGDRVGVGAGDRGRPARRAEREAAVTRAEVEDALPAEETRAAVRAELALRDGPQLRRRRRQEAAEDARHRTTSPPGASRHPVERLPRGGGDP